VGTLWRPQRRGETEKNLESCGRDVQANENDKQRKNNYECRQVAGRLRNDIQVDFTVMLMAREVIGIIFADLHDMR